MRAAAKFLENAPSPILKTRTAEPYFSPKIATGTASHCFLDRHHAGVDGLIFKDVTVHEIFDLLHSASFIGW